MDNVIPKGMNLIHTLKGHKSPIGRIAWSPDGKYLASPSGGKAKTDDNSIRIWDSLKGFKEISPFKEHEKRIICVAWSYDSKFLASGSDDRTFNIWEIGKTLKDRTLSYHMSPVCCLDWKPNSHTIVSGSNDGKILLADYPFTKHRLLMNLETHPRSLSWSTDGDELILTSTKAEFYVWESRSGLQHIFPGHSSEVLCSAWIPYHKKFLTGSKDKTIILWDFKTKSKIHTFYGHADLINSISVSYDGCLLASKSYDNTIKLWSLNDYRLLASIPANGHGYLISGISFHPSKSLLASLEGNDSIIKIWGFDYDKLLKTKIFPVTKIPSIHEQVNLTKHKAFYNQVVTDEELRESTEKLFMDGHFALSVQQAYICVCNIVKKKSGCYFDGAKLMREVFSKEKPILKLNKLKNQTQIDQQEGYMNIFAGVMIGIRNPRAHEHRYFDDPDTAVELLAFANHLIQMVRKAIRTRKKVL